MTSRKKTVMILLATVVVLMLVPLLVLKGAAFGGSDDAGSQMVSQITGKAYTPWFTPVMESWIGGELPGEVESLIFCLQTGIGVGVIAFFMGRFVERRKQEKLRGLQPDTTGEKLDT